MTLRGFEVIYLTAPASIKAKPHCMKKMMIDMMRRKKWSTSLGFFSRLVFQELTKFLCESFSYLVASVRGGGPVSKEAYNTLTQHKMSYTYVHKSWLSQ